jgi:hypothetical protein
VRLEGLGKLEKNSMAASAFKPATFRLAAQRHEQLRYRVLQLLLHTILKVNNVFKVILSFASLIKHNSVMTYGGVEALNHS